MRLLHTSDWHLGAELEGRSRSEEHANFLDWLLDTLRDQEVEVLLVAGDIFHHSQPSAAAQALFYRFVDQLDGLPALRQAVFIGGNHDSASRLEAPQPLLAQRRVAVVGGYRGEDTDDMLIPVRGASGEVELVVVAVPYVHEARLRVSAGKTSEELRASTVEAFTELYTSLGKQAQQRWPDAAIIGMGHLTCGEATDEDYGTALHNVGTIEALPGSIFSGELYRYVALGHIHRGYRVANSPASYSGAPLSLRFNRSELSPRRVSLVDGATGDYTRLDIPETRALRQLQGPLDALESQLRAMTKERELETWLSLVIEIDEPMLDAMEHFRAIAPPGVVVVKTQQRRMTPLERLDEQDQLPDVREMTAREIFVELYRVSHGGVPQDTVLQKFDEIVAQVRGEAKA